MLRAIRGPIVDGDGERHRDVPRLRDVTTLEKPAIAAASWVFSKCFLYRVNDGGYRRMMADLGITKVLGPATTIAEMWEQIYTQLLASYRIEYVYKNEIIHRLVLPNHPLNRSAIALERPIARFLTRVDLLAIGETTSAYEIKTDHDRLDRLDRQMAENLRAFDQVYVTCSDRYVEAVRDRVDERVGIVCMLPGGELRTIRRHIPNAGSIDPLAVFEICRKPEYERIATDLAGPLPKDGEPLDRWLYCQAAFERLTPRVAHRILVDVLHTRFFNSQAERLVPTLPRALSSLYFSLTSTQRRETLGRSDFAERMGQRIGQADRRCARQTIEEG